MLPCICGYYKRRMPRIVVCSVPHRQLYRRIRGCKLQEVPTRCCLSARKPQHYRLSMCAWFRGCRRWHVHKLPCWQVQGIRRHYRGCVCGMRSRQVCSEKCLNCLLAMRQRVNFSGRQRLMHWRSSQLPIFCIACDERELFFCGAGPVCSKYCGFSWGFALKCLCGYHPQQQQPGSLPPSFG